MWHPPFRRNKKQCQVRYCVLNVNASPHFGKQSDGEQYQPQEHEYEPGQPPCGVLCHLGKTKQKVVNATLTAFNSTKQAIKSVGVAVKKKVQEHRCKHHKDKFPECSSLEPSTEIPSTPDYGKPGEYNPTTPGGEYNPPNPGYGQPDGYNPPISGYGQPSGYNPIVGQTAPQVPITGNVGGPFGSNTPQLFGQDGNTGVGYSTNTGQSGGPTQEQYNPISVGGINPPPNDTVFGNTGPVVFGQENNNQNSGPMGGFETGQSSSSGGFATGQDTTADNVNSGGFDSGASSFTGGSGNDGTGQNVPATDNPASTGATGTYNPESSGINPRIKNKTL